MSNFPAYPRAVLRVDEGEKNVLNAAGTPMMRPLPLSSVERLTLSPGEPSTRSTLGILSPTLTMVAAVVWKGLQVVGSVRGRVRARKRVLIIDNGG